MSTFHDAHTRCIRGGSTADPVHGAVLPPIYQSTTFRQAAVGQPQDHTYSRASNPTVAAFEDRFGELEDALPSVAFSTGMAAITTLCLAVLKAGDRVVCSDVVYGGTFRFLREVLDGFGVESVFVDSSDPGEVAEALAKPTRLVLLETPANPTLKLTDITACADLAREAGALVAVDNTFLTPVLQRPLDLGADLSLYSTTKYVDGHNATVGGAINTRNEELRDRLAYIRTTLGTIQTPHNAWLTLQGLKTLPLRLGRHVENARKVARVLESNPLVENVRHPDLASFPQHDLARRQQDAGGGLITFEVCGGLEAAAATLKGLRLCTPAENLGSAETLATHPATMTHHSIPADDRRRLGITDGLIRLSVGLEDPYEIAADIEQALECSTKEVRHA